MISTFRKDFHGKDDPNSLDVQELFSESADFYDKFQQVAKNIARKWLIQAPLHILPFKQLKNLQNPQLLLFWSLKKCELILFRPHNTSFTSLGSSSLALSCFS